MKIKKILITAFFMLILACFPACNSSDKNESSEATSEEITTETKYVDKSSESSVVSETDDIDDITEENETMNNMDNIVSEIINSYDPENPEKTVISILESGFNTIFGDNLDITYNDDKSDYAIVVWKEGFSDAVKTEQGVSALNKMGSSLITTIDTMKTKIRQIDKDANIVFSIVDDKDQKTPILTIYNDEITYKINEE